MLQIYRIKYGMNHSVTSEVTITIIKQAVGSDFFHFCSVHLLDFCIPVAVMEVPLCRCLALIEVGTD